MRILFLIGILTWVVTSQTYASSVRNITVKSARSLALELESYLKQNPEAPDRAAGFDRLASAYSEAGDIEKAMMALKERYPLVLKGSDTDIATMFNEIVGPYVLMGAATGRKGEAKELLSRARRDFATHREAGNVMQFLAGLDAQLQIPGVGETLTIAFTGTKGEKVDLAAMKGKIVLVDFWATWCAPCIAELPSIIEAYRKHHEKGLEIIGISLDIDKVAMDKLIKAQGMDWPQYFDGKGPKNDIARAHSITTIPATFLVGKDGKIVATNLRGDALDKKVTELLAVP